ncbi:arsenate reductase-like protein [Nitritalea halalkaliphila LW7]|uniref:Arsenate reductase-like protein n=1 Tax=Nitritalea halalkaliphila LW7 TaxID=1189621 RepID=I5C529_9BACT|nr:arsenate reductase-like protein [Nitritalea halalkaliphila]EIM76931.1 arsenate reductase-like protein [Nitritalea halalkaliphila LW7]
MFDLGHQEIKFLYHSDDLKDREAFGYATALDQHTMNEVNVAKTPLTQRHFAELATKLGVPIIELFDKQHDRYEEEIASASFSDQDLLDLLHRDPSRLKTPILIAEFGARFLESPFDTHQIDLAVAGIKINPNDNY